MPDLLQKCRAFIAENDLLKTGDRVLVACSGGPDSMVLAGVLQLLGYDLGLAHCNFQLREEAIEEEKLVQGWAAKQGIPCHVVRFDTKIEKEEGESVQMAARRLRYVYFRTLCAEQGYKRIATAHHRDDQVETLIMSFLRARSGKLLEGIPLRNGTIIRPLLCASKEEILAFAHAQGIPYAVDASNLTDAYDRNHIRNQVIPALEKLNPSFRSRFLEQYQDLQLQTRLREETFQSLLPRVVFPEGDGTVVDFQGFRQAYSQELLPLFLTWYLEGLQWKGAAAREARRILHAEVGAVWETAEHQLLRDRDRIVLRPRKEPAGWHEIMIEEADLPAKFQVGEKELEMETVPASGIALEDPPVNLHHLDMTELKFPLCVRPWRQGDRMQPLGMKGHKLLSDIFIDQRIDRFAKERALVIEDEGGIVLLDGYRIADRVKIGPETRQVLRIEIRPGPETA